MWTIEMRRSKINEGKVAGQYCHLGDPSKKMVLRAGGIMRSSEVKKIISRTGFWAWPCGLMYKTVFVAVPTGVVLCVAGVAELQKALPKCKIYHNAEK
jgi:hypothetical protein